MIIGVKRVGIFLIAIEYFTSGDDTSECDRGVIEYYVEECPTDETIHKLEHFCYNELGVDKDLTWGDTYVIGVSGVEFNRTTKYIDYKFIENVFRFDILQGTNMVIFKEEDGIKHAYHVRVSSTPYVDDDSGIILHRDVDALVEFLHHLKELGGDKLDIVE